MTPCVKSVKYPMTDHDFFFHTFKIFYMPMQIGIKFLQSLVNFWVIVCNTNLPTLAIENGLKQMVNYDTTLCWWIGQIIIPIKYSWANYTNSLVNHGICNKNRFHYRKMFPLAGWYFLPPNPISSSTEAEVHSNAISYVASRAVSGCRCHGGSAWKLEITPQS